MNIVEKHFGEISSDVVDPTVFKLSANSQKNSVTLHELLTFQLFILDVI